MESVSPPRKLWEHPNPKSTEMYKFMMELNKTKNLQLKSFDDLSKYSTTHSVDFWEMTFHNLGLIYSGTYSKVVDETARMDATPPWFEGISINYAENVLYTREPGQATSTRSTKGKEDWKIAITEIREGGKDVRHMTWAQLRTEVAELTSAMRNQGMRKGDRVAIVGANQIEAIKVFLAATALGGIFSSASTDMGVKGILDRLLQIEPRWLFIDDSAIYNGKTLDLRGKINEVLKSLRKVKAFKGCIVIPRFKKPADISKIPQCQTLRSFLDGAGPDIDVFKFEPVTFSDPALIVYSSGTTGPPKCIVHSVGGLLIAGGKESKYHHNFTPESCFLQYTTTSWIMFFIQVAAVTVGARIVLYDGSPFIPNPLILLTICEQRKVTALGISPRWMHELQKLNIRPREVANLENLELVITTGMILPERLFEWFYDVGFPKHAHLANMSGGTDIAACFAISNPITPLYVGGMHGISLGTAVEVFDPTLEGSALKSAPVPDGTPGELVATKAFPNMPVMFWGDKNKQKYLSSYFGKFDNVWTHGDFIMVHPQTKQILFLGRSDGVLNPSGVRFGSAELYNVLEAKFPQVLDAIAVGQRRPDDADERVMMFLKMKPGEKFTQGLVNDIKKTIRSTLSARHVPAFIFETPDIPTTVTFKKVELPVKQIVSGKIVKPSETLANPESLKYFYQFAKVEELVERGRPSKL